MYNQEIPPQISPGEKSPNEFQLKPENFCSPENIPTELLEKYLREGEIINIQPIEEILNTIPKHTEQVEVGSLYMNGDHSGQVIEAIMVLPTEEKPLLIVYKPDSGLFSHPEDCKINIPENSSPPSNKEEAMWKIAQCISEIQSDLEQEGVQKYSYKIQDLFLPVVIRNDLPSGRGSIRPFYWGDVLGNLSEETGDSFYEDDDLLKTVSLIDGLINNVDRREENLLFKPSKTGLLKPQDQQVKLIDHSISFLNEDFQNEYYIRGVRLNVAYDQNNVDHADRPKLKYSTLEVSHKKILERIVQPDHKLQIIQILVSLLNPEEIEYFFKNAEKMLELNSYI